YNSADGFVALTSVLKGEAKWDAVAFVVKDKLVAPLFVELSGGTGFNASKGKESGEVIGKIAEDKDG
ncbi:hypothetical protein CU097_003317, partial [Rhizopus azygosporus]